MIDHLSNRSNIAATLLDVLRSRTAIFGGETAYTFVSENDADESITYAELDLRARAIATELRKTTQPGDRVLLLYPAGLDFITAFFGCVYAKVLAVPTCYPKPKRPMPRLAAIGRDARASVVMTNSKTLELVSVARQHEDLSSAKWLSIDQIPESLAADWEVPDLSPNDIVFLQYTSGSTNTPKGVMVSHGNLVHNLESIREGFRLEFQENCDEPTGKGVFWLPAYHDMGLIGGILTSLYVGGESILMSPTDFLRRPVRWLQAISQHRANVSGAPNFAFELCVDKIADEQCVDLDLSSWSVGFCGAEPIRAETLERFVNKFAPCGFQPESLYPCYGLAESTLLAAGGDGPAKPVLKRCLRDALAQNVVEDANGHNHTEAQRLVSCGRPRLRHQIKIVNPETRTECASDIVGEIWVRGPSVAAGYWNRPQETAETFQARLGSDGDGAFLRTGDLGFLSDSELYITGRVKDVIIIRGRNLYPQDLERTVAESHPGLRLDAGAAFSIEVQGEEQLGIVHEVDRNFRRDDLSEVARLVRRMIIAEHEVDPHVVVLIRQASLPVTSSGKVQRSLCRQLYLEGKLKVHFEWVNKSVKNEQAAQRPQVESELSEHFMSEHGEGANVARTGASRRAVAATVTVAKNRHLASQNGTGGNGTSLRRELPTAPPENSSSPHGGRSQMDTNLAGSDRRNGNSSRHQNGSAKNGSTNVGSSKTVTPPPEVPQDRPMTADEVDRLAERIGIWLMDWLMRKAQVPRSEIRGDKPFADYGLDSLTAVEMSQDIEDWLGVQVTATVAWNYPTSTTMARYLAREVAGVPESPTILDPSTPAPEASEFEQILGEIENLSDEEVERLLNDA